MDDEQRYFKIPVKGETYTFKPVAPDDLERMVVIFNMGIGTMKMMKAITNMLQPLLSEGEWDRLTDRLVGREIGVRELVDAFQEVIKRQTEDKPAKKSTARKRAAGAR